MIMTSKALYELCKLYYDEDTLKHAERVANIAKRMVRVFESYKFDEDYYWQLGLAHDLYEDTKIPQNVWFEDTFEKNLQLLTRKKDENYFDYVNKIEKMAFSNLEYLPAYIVKLADIADHFSQQETLTERLKDKYAKAIPCLIHS